MANPVEFNIPKETITKVATDVVTGILHKRFETVYKQSYRLTGESAPTDPSEFVVLFDEKTQEEISSSDPIDVYVYCPVSTGKIRADL